MALIKSSIAGVVLAFIVFFGIGYIGFRNSANSYEIGIAAQYDQNKNDYDNGWKKVMEVAQIPAMQMNQTKELYTAVMTGRYGTDGSKAFASFIQEQNPNLSPQLYIEIQQTVQAFRDKFEASQTNLISRKQEYSRFIQATTTALMYNWIGNYPHIKVGIPIGASDDYQIVTSDRTQTDFQNHKSEPLQIK